MRIIHVSIDVFAAIWRDRRPGEESEDAVLARRFKVERRRGAEGHSDATIGFHDPRFGVSVPAEFSIHRIFNGKEYRAHAIQGFWILDATGQRYATLNRLSVAIGAGNEDAWRAWFYDDDGGVRRPVSDLRDPSKIKKRGKRPAAEPDWDNPEA